MNANTPTLRFNNGRFKIMQVTDLHWVESNSYKAGNDKTYNLIKEMIDLEHPDLVMLTGDIVVSWNAEKGWERLASLLEEKQIPFAVTFGNHDPESNMNNKQTLSYLESFSYHITGDDANVSGAGNCYLPVYSSNGEKCKWNLYLFDSHNLTNNATYGYYAWIKPDQVNWYRNTRDKLIKQNAAKLPALAFFHIPFPEFETAIWLGHHELGNKKEGVSAPRINSGLFSAFIEKRDVIGAFVGHDHNNDYLLDINGDIALAYGRKTGFNSAYEEVLNRGVRIINLTEDEPSFHTYVRDLEGVHFKYFFEQKNQNTVNPCFCGSFVNENLVSSWNNKRWDLEMSMLKQAGINYLIFSPILHTSLNGKHTISYKSKLYKKSRKSTLEKSLESAKKHGIKIFIGLNFDERWREYNYDDNWINKQMEIGNQISDELVMFFKEKYPTTMYGWYWPWEIDNINWNSQEKQNSLITALNTTLNYLTEISPDMPFLLSPSMNSSDGLNLEEYADMWVNIFKHANFRIGDIIAPQDGIGTEKIPLRELKDWFSMFKKIMKNKPGMKLWANVEIFDQKYNVTASLERIKSQLDIVDNYVNNIICSSYSQFISPFAVSDLYHNAYIYYCNKGDFPKNILPSDVIDIKATKNKKGIELEWKILDSENVTGFNIYRDGELIRKIQVQNDNAINYGYHDANGDKTSSYEIASYNIFGAESEKSKAITLLN